MTHPEAATASLPGPRPSQHVTAAQYDAFTRRFPVHRLTSADLVELARPSAGMTILDLCCGTGVTTAEILRRVGLTAEIVAVDVSEEMLEIAREQLDAPNVEWVRCRGEEVDAHVGAGVDLAICNSAFWLMDMPKTAAALHRILAPNGRLAFNLPDRVLVPASKPGEHARSQKPPLYMVAQAIAVLVHDYVLPPQLTVDRELVEALLRQSGFAVEAVATSDYELPIEADYEYLGIPAVSAGRFPGLPPRTRSEIVEAAYERCDKTQVRRSVWTTFLATAGRADAEARF
jgi:ubiquinone/menaquinone biosynthesis C-methylase UbiE